MKTDSTFRAGYALRVRQPLDHANPGGKSFLQSVYVAHIDYTSPVLFETEGYTARGGGRPRELTSILKSNQIVVRQASDARGRRCGQTGLPEQNKERLERSKSQVESRH